MTNPHQGEPQVYQGRIQGAAWGFAEEENEGKPNHMTKRDVKIKILIEADVNDDQESNYGLQEILKALEATARETSADEYVLVSYKILNRSGSYFESHAKKTGDDHGGSDRD